MIYNKNRGFTLVELIVVIVILGILAAVALPKFMNVSTSAHKSAVDGAAGSYASAVALVHSAWMANGADTSAIDDISGFGSNNVDVNTSGWPTDTGDTNILSTDAHCVNVWNGIMQTNSPTVSATADNADFYAQASGASCVYLYEKDNVATRQFVYSSADGSVTKTNP